MFAPSTAVDPGPHIIPHGQGVIFPTSSINSSLLRSVSVANANPIKPIIRKRQKKIFNNFAECIKKNYGIILIVFYTSNIVLQVRIRELLKSFARKKQFTFCIFYSWHIIAPYVLLSY